MFAALLDTCVLWPSLQRDVLLSFAVEGIYRPVWSSAILSELEFHEAQKLVTRHDVEVEEAERRAASLIRTMRGAFDDAEVHGWEGLEGSYGLPDPDDEHVVAAAVVAGVGAIVTNNLKDFPREKVPSGIDLQSPADFGHNTVSLNPVAAYQAISKVANRSGRKGPLMTVPDILDLLVERYGFDEAVDLLRPLY